MMHSPKEGYSLRSSCSGSIISSISSSGRTAACHAENVGSNPAIRAFSSGSPRHHYQLLTRYWTPNKRSAITVAIFLFIVASQMKCLNQCIGLLPNQE
jgi:hypothetical protein